MTRLAQTCSTISRGTLLSALVLSGVACGGGAAAPPGSAGATAPVGGGAGGAAGVPTSATAWQLRSSGFESGGTLPKDYTCDGGEKSPHLVWDPAPPRSQSIALIFHDPDAPGGDFTHWIVFNMAQTQRGLDVGVSAPTGSRLTSGALEGKNDFGKQGYGGPCPPRGPAHRYVVDLYALDQKLTLEAGATKAQLQQAMSGHMVAQAQLTGRYSRA